VQDLLGPVSHLRNVQLRERHWNAVAELLGRQVDRSPAATTSIATLLDMQVSVWDWLRVMQVSHPAIDLLLTVRQGYSMMVLIAERSIHASSLKDWLQHSAPLDAVAELLGRQVDRSPAPTTSIACLAGQCMGLVSGLVMGDAGPHLTLELVANSTAGL
jgi:hypothetical protein